MSRTLTIDRLGSQGDGVAEGPDGPLYVPFTLPGETVEVDGASHPKPVAIVEASPARVDPPCPHFGTCGGCELQHADEASYRAFKRRLVVDAIARADIEAEVGDLVPCKPGTRRRLALTAARVGGKVHLGFNAAQSNHVVDIDTCPVALPVLQRALPGLRELAAILVDRKRPMKMTVTATATGLDVSVEGAAKLSEKMRGKPIEKALSLKIARLTVGGETQVQSRAPVVKFGDIAVEMPAGAFVQAVKSAEDEMAGLVTGHLVGAKKIADLFSGCGAFALRLAATSAVHAVEAEAAPLEAMNGAWRRNPGFKPLTTERRDLYRRPINAKDFRFYDAVVFDPPRAGAEAISRELAGSKVSRVAAVSCNPVTFARDIKLLIDGGFRLKSVTPIDQFLWSHHVEVVALLER